MPVVSFSRHKRRGVGHTHTGADAPLSIAKRVVGAGFIGCNDGIQHRPVFGMAGPRTVEQQTGNEPGHQRIAQPVVARFGLHRLIERRPVFRPADCLAIHSPCASVGIVQAFRCLGQDDSHQFGVAGFIGIGNVVAHRQRLDAVGANRGSHAAGPASVKGVARHIAALKCGDTILQGRCNYANHPDLADLAPVRPLGQNAAEVRQSVGGIPGESVGGFSWRVL